jgi:hypothetical protein
MNYLKELLEEEEKLFKIARDFLGDNFDKSFTIDQLSKETGIDRRLINKWIKEGRFKQGRTINNSKDAFIDELIKSIDKDK